jgi:hypothetical protein
MDRIVLEEPADYARVALGVTRTLRSATRA